VAMNRRLLGSRNTGPARNGNHNNVARFSPSTGDRMYLYNLSYGGRLPCERRRRRSQCFNSVELPMDGNQAMILDRCKQRKQRQRQWEPSSYAVGENSGSNRVGTITLQGRHLQSVRVPAEDVIQTACLYASLMDIL